ncbi:MAG: thermonuclease family protein [Gammaproteobacteria bacterium]
MWNSGARVLGLVLALVVPVAPAAGRTMEGRVVKVIDGDSFVMRVGGQEVEVRLAQIDAPEFQQPYGPQARQALARIVAGRRVQGQVRDRDRYGRHVVELTIDGRDVEQELVAAGAAWVYDRYARDPRLKALEAEARAGRRGLWGQPDAAIEPPWHWRERERAARGATAPAGPVIANRRSGVYHLPGCPGFTATGPGNRQSFDSEAQARAAGYRRARNCP